MQARVHARRALLYKFDTGYGLVVLSVLSDQVTVHDCSPSRPDYTITVASWQRPARPNLPLTEIALRAILFQQSRTAVTETSKSSRCFREPPGGARRRAGRPKSPPELQPPTPCRASMGCRLAPDSGSGVFDSKRLCARAHGEPGWHHERPSSPGPIHGPDWNGGRLFC
jgi:hypothetical protein